MICRHTKNDPNCSSHPDNRDYGNAPTIHSGAKSSSYADRSTDPSPDADRFDIEALEEIGSHLVVKARYPDCASCAYEGNKVLVFFNCTCKQAAMWRKLDPHFRDPKKHVASAKVAPPPDARFPASLDGWKNAIAFTRMMTTQR